MRKLCVASAWILLSVMNCLAQGDRGTFTGIVTDNSGGVVPVVTINVTNTLNNSVYKSATTGAGAYTVPNLPVGTYKLEFIAPGFKKAERSNLQLTQGQVQRLDITLEVGAVTETVEVNAVASGIETDTPRVSTNMPNSQLRDLPVSMNGASGGRTAEDWVFKVVPGIGGSSWTTRINGLSVQGQRETFYDGAPVGANISGVIAESSVSIEAVEEVNITTSGYSAEYGHLANGVFNYSLKSGQNDIHGSAYAALRNEAFNANTFVNNFAGLPRNFDRKQNAAISFGGPIYIPKIYNGRSKTFFYATYERYRQNQTGRPGPNAAYPLKEFYDGDFSRLLIGGILPAKDALGRDVPRGAIYDPQSAELLPNGRYIANMFPGNVIPTARISRVSQNINKIGRERYLPTVVGPDGLVPLQNNAETPSSGLYQKFDQHQFSLKLDHNVSDKHKLSFTHDYTGRPKYEPRGGLWDWNDPTGGPWAQYFIQPLTTKRYRISEDWTISPTVYNRILVFHNRLDNPLSDANDGVDGAAAYGIQGLSLNNYPLVNWGNGPVYPLSQKTSFVRQYDSATTWGYSDTISFAKGKHFLKAGFETRRQFQNSVPTPAATFNFTNLTTSIPQEQNAITSFTGYGFASYLLGGVSSGSLSVPAPRTRKNDYHGAFLQDDFKVRRNLTLNLGVRWEYSPLVYESFDRQTSWDPNVIDPISGLKGAYTFAGKCSVCTGSRTFGKRDFNNFAPRIGFAWQAVKNFTVRGSFTVQYLGDNSGLAGNIVGNGSYNLNADPVFPWKPIFNWDAGFPQDRFVAPTYDRSYANTFGVNMVDPRYGTTPYVTQWSINLQKALPGRVILDAGYMGNHSVKLFDSGLVRMNQTPTSVIDRYGSVLNRSITSASEAAALGVPYPYPGFRGTVNSALRQFPQVRANDTWGTSGAPEGFGRYDAMTIIVNRQFTRGFALYANWVWSKTMCNCGSMMDYYNRAIAKSIDSNDMPHIVKIFAQYELPIGKGKAVAGSMPRVLNALLGNWVVSMIGTYSSGTPIGFSGAVNITGWNGGANRLNVAPGELNLGTFERSNYDYANRNLKGYNQFFDTSLVTAPPAGAFGTGATRFAQLRNFASQNEDLGLQKDFRIKEKYRGQIRAQFLNAFNRHSLGGIQTNITNPQFGQVTGNPGGNRSIEIGARVDF
jgi:hypothetical protein